MPSFSGPSSRRMFTFEPVASSAWPKATSSPPWIFDTQQTGQLMSRATVDLGAIRFFLGYGLIFITQNLLTIVLVSAVMFIINPLLALIALAPAPFIVYTASRYNRVSRPAQQEVQ